MTPRFEQALAQFLYARDRVNGRRDDTTTEEDDLLFDGMTTAEERLFAIPASNIAELRVKAEILWNEPGSIPGEQMQLQFMTDLHRLTGNAQSRVFDVGGWLSLFQRNGGGWVVRDGEVFLFGPKDNTADAFYALDAANARQLVKDTLLARAALVEVE
jgi:hypothetical protein